MTEVTGNDKHFSGTNGNDTVNLHNGLRTTREGHRVEALGHNNTVNTGAGDDDLRITGQRGGNINAGSGNDRATVFRTNDTVIVTGTEQSALDRAMSRTHDDRDNVTINTSTNVSVQTGRGNDSISINNSSGNINAGSGNDSVHHSGRALTRGAHSVIDGGAGHDVFETNELVSRVVTGSRPGETTLVMASGDRVTLRGFEQVIYNGDDHGPSGNSPNNAGVSHNPGRGGNAR